MFFSHFARALARPANVRVTSEVRPGTKVEGWRDACWLSGIFSLLIIFFLFSVTFQFWTLKTCKHRDKAQVWFTRMFCSETYL
jgi:hypothetical protein